MKHRGWMVGIALIAALAAGVGAGYLIWGWPTNWYARDVTQLPASSENDVIRYGHAAGVGRRSLYDLQAAAAGAPMQEHIGDEGEHRVQDPICANGRRSR